MSAALLRLYPARTRRRFGDDLAAVTAELIETAYGRGGSGAVLCLWPRLLADLGSALLSEYGDLWRGSASGASRFSAACLLTSSVVWVLIAAASMLEIAWAAAILDASLPMTMFMAFGLPAIALAMSRACRMPGIVPAYRLTTFRLSAAATAASWSFLAVHIVQHT